MLIYTDHFNVYKEYQRIKAADNFKIVYEDNEKEPKITEDLIDLISKDENQKENNEELMSFRRIKEELSSEELSTLRRDNNWSQDLKSILRANVLERRRGAV